MQSQLGLDSDEVTQLRRCMNDLVSLLGLPAIWVGGGASLIGATLRDVLFRMLDLDLFYAQLSDPVRGEVIEIGRVVPTRAPPLAPAEIGRRLRHELGDDARSWTPVDRLSLDGDSLSALAMPLGLRGDAGVLVAGSFRAVFPTPTERLLLRVAANQAAIGLQGARMLVEQQRVARELDKRVAERTRELAAANEELQNEVMERRRTEEALQRSETFLVEGQKLARLGNFSWRVATDEIKWSEQLYRIFEFDPGIRITHDRIASRVHPDDLPLLHDMIQRARRGASDFEYEHRLLMPDQSVKFLHLVAHGGLDRHRRLEYLGAVQDVTDRRTSETALDRARADLARVARVSSLGTLAASIAHEVNQPLAGIITNASTCLRMLQADPPNVEGARETARRTIRDGTRASEVVARLRGLFTSKGMSAGAVDLNDAAREVISLSMRELQRNRVVLRTELAADLPVVTADRVQLQQVILNLLRNAADAMCEMEDRPRSLLVKTQLEGEDAVCLSVRDDGVGLPRHADRMFDAFYTTKSAGMGIGLSISRSIVESHGGRLWAAPNAPSPGATFGFSIPRQPRMQ